MAVDKRVRPEYRRGTWAYAVGKPATKHRSYSKAVAIAERQGWDAGWIRSWSDVAAVVKGGCWFDEKTANWCVGFFETFLTLRKGKYAGQQFLLIDYQKYDLIMPLFGWKRADGTRRFSKGSIWMPKKNAKSALCSGIGLLMLTADRAGDPEIYSVAGDRKQASIIHDESAKMAKASNALKKHLQFIDSQKTIRCTYNFGKFVALSADAELQEGINWLLVLFDELHVQKNRKMFDTLAGGGISRENGLFLSISTAGVYDKHSIGWEEWEYNRRVREGTIDDWGYFAVAYYSERDADWQDPKEWLKANPGIDITFIRRNLEAIFRAAQNSPAKQNQFRRYHLNQWTQQAERWLDITIWQKCDMPVIERELEGRTAFGAFDGAGKLDLNSWGLVFPPEGDDEYWRFLSRNWVPQGCIYRRATEDKVPYDLWVEDGWMQSIPGLTIDQRWCVSRIIEDGQRFNIREIAFDPAWSRAIEGPLLDEGFEMVEFIQSMRNYTTPMSELEKLLTEEKIAHGGNPVLEWAFDNLVVKTNHNKEMKPDKGQVTERIDPAVAIFMALGRAIVHRGDGRSMYEDEKPERITA